MSDGPSRRGGSVGRFGSGSTGGGSTGGGDGGGGVFEPGNLISYTYEVVELVARGGMGEVYRTRHTEIGTEHAIKIVRPDLANNDKIMELFRREAAVLRTVRDDAIVGYDGVLRDEEGRVYLVMEFVDGPSLTTFLEDRVLTLEEVRDLRDHLARGLAAAHAKGIIHRDMSPDNVILGNGELAHAKIIDFGIAKLADSSATTIIGDDFAGRYAYASPEQIGLYGGQVDARSDVYSLGLVLATAATGKALNMGEISESLVSIIEARKRIPDFSSVPPELRSELGSMLEPDPADRPESMLEVIGLDQRLREGAEAAQAPLPASEPKPEPPQPEPPQPEPPQPESPQPEPPHAETAALAAEPAARPAVERQRRWLTPVLAAGVAVIAAGGYVVWQQSEEGPAATPPVAQAPAASSEPPEMAVATAEAPPEPEAESTAPVEDNTGSDEPSPAAGSETPSSEVDAAVADTPEEAASEATTREDTTTEAPASEAPPVTETTNDSAAAESVAPAAALPAPDPAKAQPPFVEAEGTVSAEADDLEAAAVGAEDVADAADAAPRETATEAPTEAAADTAPETQMPADEQVAAVPEKNTVDLQLAGLKAAEAQLTGEEKQEIQRDLQALGHYSGAIDGDFGPGTRRSIEAYQVHAGLDATGYLLAEARAALAEEAAPLRAAQERQAAERAAAEQAAAEQAAADKAASEAAAARARAAAEARQPAEAPAQQAARPNEGELERLIRHAESGDMLAQASLGQRYYRGRGVERDLAEAARWTRMAAEQGEPRAQSNLGFYYMKGEGVPRDPAEAARWWRAAADQGLPQAQFNLGMLYESGQGVTVDYAEAARWYELAAAQGDRAAQDRLRNLQRRNLIPGDG